MLEESSEVMTTDYTARSSPRQPMITESPVGKKKNFKGAKRKNQKNLSQNEKDLAVKEKQRPCQLSVIDYNEGA